MSLAERRWLRLITLCVLYVAQGIPWGFMATTLPAYLAEHGVEDIGPVMAMSYLPYSFKWIWGPIIDTFTIPRFGRRRPWILLAQGMMAATLGAMITFDVARELQLLLAMMFVHTVFNSLQDVAVDALAVDLLSEEERGRANGLMYASKYAGGAMGGAGMAYLVTYTSLRTALSVQTAILVAIMLLPLFVREREPGEQPVRESVRAIGSALLQAFSLRSPLIAVVLVTCAMFCSGMTSALATRLFVKELGWNAADYTAISGGWGLGVGCACAAITGFVGDKLGRKRVAAVASCALAAGWIVSAVLRSYWTEEWFVWLTALYGAASLSVWSVSLVALAMDVSWPRIAGSQFTAYMALLNLGTTLGNLMSSRVLDAFGFQGAYIFAGVVQVAVALLLLPIDPGETRRKLPLPAGTRPNPLAIAALFAMGAFLIYMTVRSLLDTL